VISFLKNQDGLAATEAALLFPILFAFIMGVFDLGQGITLNQKTVTASQVIGDLITRNETVDTDMINDIVKAGELALAPYPLADFGYDIISVEFDEDGDPFVLWRTTENMDEDDAPLEDTIDLGGPGEGVVIVNITNRYVPYFSRFVVDEIKMEEIAFLRGRRSATVICTDCP